MPFGATGTVPKPSKITKSYLPPGDCKDVVDYTVIKFGAEICLRGSVGSYMHAYPVIVENNSNPTFSSNASVSNLSMSITQASFITSQKSISGSQGGPITVYILGVSGQGVGEALDCISFVNIDKVYVP